MNNAGASRSLVYIRPDICLQTALMPLVACVCSTVEIVYLYMPRIVATRACTYEHTHAYRGILRGGRQTLETRNASFKCTFTSVLNDRVIPAALYLFAG